MVLFRLLRFLERFVAMGEIGAGILPVPIEEQAVEAAIQIIMMRDISLRSHGGVVLIETTLKPSQERGKPQDRQPTNAGREVGEYHVEHVVDAATFRRY